jgi:hypothetical protein
MITLEQAQALQSGDVVWLMSYQSGQVSYTELLVYEPDADALWQDRSIVKYLRSANFGVPTYIFRENLDAFTLERGR